MKAASRPTPPPNDPLDEGPRVEWGTAVLVFVELALALPIALLLFFDELALPPFFPPLLLFLALRLPGDIARAVASTKPAGLAVEGPSKSLAWGSVPFGVASLFTGSFRLDPLWLTGAGATLFALALWGHHARALPHAPRIARIEGTTGAALAPFALAAASTFLAPLPPWNAIVPAGILVLTGALAARGIVRLHRSRHTRVAEEGWTAWYQAHFFRLSVLIAAVLVYLFVRDTLAGFVPFLFLFEYSFAVFVAAGFLWSLRGFARKRMTDAVPVGPHRRHEQAVERQGETRFDREESAFGRFLETGDADEVAAVAQRLHQEGVDAQQAFAALLSHRAERGVLLVHPAWLYGARLLVVALIAWSITSALPSPFGERFALLLVAIGVYTAQWNRYGGPWIVKTGLGLAGLVFLGAFLGAADATSTAATLPGAVAALVLLGLPLLHPLRARKGRPVPRFLYNGQDPLDAIHPLIQRYDRSILMRAAWLGAIGIVVFIVVGELSRFVPEAEVLFTLYLAFAFSFLAQPVLLTAGLRTGRAQAERRHRAARQHRERILRDALGRMRDMLAAHPPRQRQPQRR